MRSQELNKEIADKMLLKAERLDVEQSEYISYQHGQPRKEELEELLKQRYPNRDYMIIEEINGRTIIRLQDECKSATSKQGCSLLYQ